MKSALFEEGCLTVIVTTSFKAIHKKGYYSLLLLSTPVAQGSRLLAKVKKTHSLESKVLSIANLMRQQHS